VKNAIISLRISAIVYLSITEVQFLYLFILVPILAYLLGRRV